MTYRYPTLQCQEKTFTRCEGATSAGCTQRSTQSLVFASHLSKCHCHISHFSRQKWTIVRVVSACWRQRVYNNIARGALYACRHTPRMLRKHTGSLYLPSMINFSRLPSSLLSNLRCQTILFHCEPRAKGFSDQVARLTIAFSLAKVTVLIKA